MTIREVVEEILSDAARIEERDYIIPVPREPADIFVADAPKEIRQLFSYKMKQVEILERTQMELIFGKKFTNEEQIQLGQADLKATVADGLLWLVLRSLLPEEYRNNTGVGIREGWKIVTQPTKEEKTEPVDSLLASISSLDPDKDDPIIH